MITQMAYLIKAIFLLSTSHHRYVVQYGESLVLFFIIRYLFPMIPQSLMQNIVCLCVFVCLCLFVCVCVCVCVLVCVRKCVYASARIFSVHLHTEYPAPLTIAKSGQTHIPWVRSSTRLSNFGKIGALSETDNRGSGSAGVSKMEGQFRFE